MSRHARSKRSRRRLTPVEATGADALYSVYSAYYRGRPRLLIPEDLDRREFAVQPWGSPSYVRHLSFSSAAEVLDFLAKHVPHHAYYSLARYELPDAPNMEEKGFLGADLMFDIDADHFPGCEGPLVSDACISKAAEAAWRLTRMLSRDLAASSITIYYTGNRGFHIIAHCSGCDTLDRTERREIAYYLAAVNIDPENIFPLRPGLEPATPTPQDPGWRGWVGEWLYRHRGNVSPRLRDAMRSAGKRGPLAAALREIIGEIAVPLDLQVTQDTSRLLRLPGSLNGKTGLRVVLVEPSRVSAFKPSPLLSPIRGDAKIEAVGDLKLDSYLGDPLEIHAGRTYRVPAHVGVALASRGLARLLEVVGDVELDAGWGPL